MSTITMASSPNGSKPRPGRTPGKVVPLLGPSIDHLLELRELIRRAQDEERKMTAEVVAGLQATGVTRLAGHQALAILDVRTTQRVDPQRLHETLGASAFQAMTVNITVARQLLGTEALLAISEVTTSPVLRVELAAPVAYQEA
jgi:hypothetical protein